MIEIEQLWNEIDLRAAALPEEQVALAEALGRVLAAEALSTSDQPPFDQSAVDGYAVAGKSPYRIVGEQVAGQFGGDPLQAGQAVRILTGAVVPEGAEAVAKQEECTLAGEWVETSAMTFGANIRRRGGVLRLGERVLDVGEVITAGAIGLLAGAGIGRASVRCRPKVLHLVTGDELVAAGEPLRQGKIHDANGPMIAALLRQREISQLGQVWLGDSSQRIAAAVANFEGDLLLISGGSGPGDRDHTLQALGQAGFEIHASRLNSRPGKPLIFATRGKQVAFGLPGNPLSHFVCYHAFVRRALDRMEGFATAALVSAKLEESILEVGDGRRTWLPGVLHGERVRALVWRHSGDLTPLAEANALILLDGMDTVDAMDCAVLALP